MTMITSFKYVRAGAFGAAAIAVAAAAVLATAAAAGYHVSLPGPSTSASPVKTAAVSKANTAGAVCDDFLKHFSGDLSSTPDKVNAAFQKAVGQTLADEAANGTITQKQADALNKKLTSQAPCALIAAAAQAPRQGPAKLPPYTKELFDAAAAALGITPQQLQADFAKGMSLSQIAAAQNPAVTEAQFRARLIAMLTPLLDKAVSDGTLTLAQEQAIIKQLQTGPIPFWNQAPKMVQKVPASG